MVLVAIDGAILITVMVLVFAGVVGLSNIIVENLDDLIIQYSMPNFEYSSIEQGNTLFDVYSQLRWITVIILFCGVLFCIAGGFLSSVYRLVLFCVLLFVFPPIWDVSTQAVVMGGLWILNPLYTFDQKNPCPTHWSPDDITQYGVQSPYYTGGNPSDACKPSHRVSYVLQQAGGLTGITPDGTSALNFFNNIINNGMDAWFVNIFGVVVKAVMLFNLVLMAVVVGVILDMFTGVVIGAFPIWIILYLIPRFRRISILFLSSVPSILLIPIFSSIILVTGSSVVASGIYDDLFGVWLSAVSVLFFAAVIPVFLVPIIGSVISYVTSAIVQGITIMIQNALKVHSPVKSTNDRPDSA